jgi:hypothetical protein
MSLTIGLFDHRSAAFSAMNALTELGLDPASNEIEEVSSKTVAQDLANAEQHPETFRPGSVQSLGAPLPPPDTDPTRTPGPLGQAYLDHGQKGLVTALQRAGLDSSTAARAAQTVENGGALVAVRNGTTGDVRNTLQQAGAQEILG